MINLCYKNNLEMVMKSALEELYFGGGGLYEKVVEGEEYDKLFSDYGEVYEKLFEGATKSKR